MDALKSRTRLTYRLLSAFIAFTFCFTTILSPGYAQVGTGLKPVPTILNLPVPGAMVGPSQAFVPVLLKGMTIHPDNPLQFDFIIDSGNTNFTQDQIKDESQRLVKYFLASMTIPKDDLWVNLSPYEKDRIIPDELGKTELGRDMLAQDYILKQLTASLMYPEKELGKEFWDKVYRQAKEKYGTTEIPVDTFNKVWILPETATVYEHGQTVYIVEAKLKVMLDQDYVAGNVGAPLVGARDKAGTSPAPTPAGNNISTSIIREIILPEIEHEVNYGQNFAPLRQIYHSLILAKWYKETIKNSLLSKVYVDKKLINGIRLEDGQLKGEDGSIIDSQSSIVDQIYNQYMEAYKKGVFNYIKEDYDRLSRETIPRKYFSGGEFLRNIPLQHSSSPIIGSGFEGTGYKATVISTPEKNRKILPIASSPMLNGSSKELQNMPAREILRVLDLDRAEMILTRKGPNDLRIQRIRVPKLQNKHKAPKGLSVLPYELFDTTDFELVLNKKGYLIAIYPVLPKTFELKTGQRTPHFFDFSEYYFEIPQLGSPDIVEKWKNYVKELQLDRDALFAYGQETGLLGKLERRPRWVPHFYAKLDTRGSFPFVDAFYTEKFQYMFENKSLRGENPEVKEALLPVFPTVYHPGSNAYSDWEYIMAVNRNLDIKKFHDVLVVGPGSGLDAWFVSLQTDQKIYAVGINPFEVANIRASAKAAGFKVEAIIHDNIISEEGVPVFDKKFDRIIWNMPTYHPPIDRTPKSLEEWEDNDIGGESLKRFAKGLPMLLKPDGFAMVWNSAFGEGVDVVEQILKLDGKMEVTSTKYPGKKFLSNIDEGTDPVPYAIYFIRLANKNKNNTSYESSPSDTPQSSSPVSADDLLSVPAGIIGALQENGQILSVKAGEVFDIGFGNYGNQIMGLAREHSQILTIGGLLALAGGIAGGLYYFWSHHTLKGNLYLLENGEFSTKQKAAERLEKWRDKRAIKPLLKYLSADHEFWALLTVTRALKNIGISNERLVEEYIKALTSDGDQTRQHAVLQLGESGDSRAFELLIGMTEDQIPAVKEAVATTLGKSNDTRAIAPLLKLLREDRTLCCSNSGPRAVAEEYLDILGATTEQKMNRYIEILGSHLGEARSHAAKRLGELGDTRAVPALLQGLNDKDDFVQSASVVALGKLKDSRAVEPLITLSENKKFDYPFYREVAEALANTGDQRALEPLRTLLATMESKGYTSYEADPIKNALQRLETSLPQSSSPASSSESEERVPTADRLVGMTENQDEVGGIDMNEIDLEKQGAGVDIQFDPTELQEIIESGIDGFAPVIINIVPLPSVLPLLGLEPGKEEEGAELSRVN